MPVLVLVACKSWSKKRVTLYIIRSEISSICVDEIRHFPTSVISSFALVGESTVQGSWLRSSRLALRLPQNPSQALEIFSSFVFVPPSPLSPALLDAPFPRLLCSVSLQLCSSSPALSGSPSSLFFSRSSAEESSEFMHLGISAHAGRSAVCNHVCLSCYDRLQFLNHMNAAADETGGSGSESHCNVQTYSYCCYH